VGVKLAHKELGLIGSKTDPVGHLEGGHIAAFTGGEIDVAHFMAFRICVGIGVVEVAGMCHHDVIRPCALSDDFVFLGGEIDGADFSLGSGVESFPIGR